jgi:Phage Mu protein F like protein
MPESIRQTINLPPTETVKFFRAKGSRILTGHWTDLWQEEHTRAFTVSKVNDLAVLNRLYAALDKVTSEGGTLAMFKADVLPDLQAAVKAGTAPERLLTDRGLATVYNTNLRMARAAGKWERVTALKDRRPYLMYSALDDGRAREQHALWGGLNSGKPIILPVDHPFWKWFFPPNGWGCRCDVIQLTDADLRDRGLSITTDAELATMGLPTSVTTDLSDIATRDFIRADGIIESVPLGIDPGFAYNVGANHLSGLSGALTAQLEAMAGNNVSIAQAVLQQVLDETAFDIFLAEDGGSFPVMVLPESTRALIGAQPSVAVISQATWVKQLARHPELGLADYRKLVEIGASPQLLLKQDSEHILLLRVDGGKWLKATVKTTKDRSELYVVSVQFAPDKEVARLIKRDEVIYDGR